MESFSVKRKLAQSIRRQREKAMGGAPKKDPGLESPLKSGSIKSSPNVNNFIKSFKKSLKVK